MQSQIFHSPGTLPMSSPSTPPYSPLNHSSNSTLSSHPFAQDDFKRIAAHRAVDFVESNMTLGLGTGSTAIHALERIASLLKSGKLSNVKGIATSKKTEKQAIVLGIPLTDLDSNPTIDLSIDGADEVDPYMNLVKGRGGSLLREKMIEGASKRFIVIIDESKKVDVLGGSKLAVPVEVVPYGWKYTLTKLRKLFDGVDGFSARLRMDQDVIFVTDNLNYIVEMFFEKGIEGDLNEISDEILKIVGVVEHGMFLGIATDVIVAGKDGVFVESKKEIYENGTITNGGKAIVTYKARVKNSKGLTMMVVLKKLVFTKKYEKRSYSLNTKG